MHKVDVIINVYGKPYQTLCTLKSLMKHSGERIDKIYFIQEPNCPDEAVIKEISSLFDNLTYYIPLGYRFIDSPIRSSEIKNPNDRYIFRYQYGIEHSDKKYAFVTHNDVLYTGDIIGEMLKIVDDGYVGIGKIGQCWNCPIHTAGICDGDRMENYNPTYEEVMNIFDKYHAARGYHVVTRMNKERPMPIPECRLNEFSALIDLEVIKKECIPNGTVNLFGSFNLDIGDMWFREMFLKGYKFKNFRIDDYSVHGYYTSLIKDPIVNASGYIVQRDVNLYNESEEFAKRYYEENFR